LCPDRFGTERLGLGDDLRQFAEGAVRVDQLGAFGGVAYVARNYPAVVPFIYEIVRRSRASLDANLKPREYQCFGDILARPIDNQNGTHGFEELVRVHGRLPSRN